MHHRTSLVKSMTGAGSDGKTFKVTKNVGIYCKPRCNIQIDAPVHLLTIVIWDLSVEDESKISNMLTETRRNREMCNQIARKVFFNQSHTTKVAPVGPDVSMIALMCMYLSI